MNEQEKNQRVAERIMSAGASNGKPYRAGEWLALLDGKVVAVAGDLDGALRALRGLDPDPGRGMVLEVGPPVVDVIR
jgi:hypothetical protein